MDRPRIRWVYRWVFDVIFATVGLLALWQYLGYGLLGAEYLAAFMLLLIVAFNAVCAGPAPESPPSGLIGSPPSQPAPSPPAPSPPAGSPGVKFGPSLPRRTGRVCAEKTFEVDPLEQELVSLDVRPGERIVGSLRE